MTSSITGTSIKTRTPMETPVAPVPVAREMATAPAGPPPLERETTTAPEPPTTKTPNPWLVHVKAFKQANPALSYKEVLQKAKETYTKVK